MVKKYTRKDKYRNREAEKYEKPVPSREHIMQYLEELGRPASFSHLLQALHIGGGDEVEGLRRRLKAMRRDGQLMTNRRGSFALVAKMELISGRVQGHRDGFGFLIPDKDGDDVFLSARQMQSVFTDDRVLVRVSEQDRRGRREGIIVEVLEHNTHQVVGRYVEEDGVAFVDPDNKRITQDILIAQNAKDKAKPGQFVVAEIITQPSSRRLPTGKIVEVLGDHLTSGMEVELAIRTHELPFKWPEAVSKLAKTFSKTLAKKDYRGRTDLRHLPFVTIDGDDARDFDDAVYCEAAPRGGWRLYVAIADVAHYVKPKSALDDEAFVRGNSVYFPSTVIPMLPEVLSNHLCSLMPKVDRLAMVCEMRISQEGKLTRYHFVEGVIHSHARLTYSQVFAALQGESTITANVLVHVEELYSLYKKLYKQRVARGTIEFETIETKIIFDDKGKIDRITPRKRNVAHCIIEEMMLLANVATAKTLEKSELATLYRVHEGPDEQKLQALKDFLKAFGLRLTGGNQPQAKDYANLLRRVREREDAHLLQTVMLRSLRQAVYAPKNVGHFGLAYRIYTHFTSPIRRYPDLLVHRALKHIIRGNKSERFFYDESTMITLGEHCSLTERRADRATRDAEDWLKCEYMLDEVGQCYPGFIVDVTGFGVFVELKDIYVQGLLHITALHNDYYHYDATAHALIGRRTGKKYRLGDPIKVCVARVDLDERQIDFELE